MALAELRDNVFLIGIMGAGKTTVARRLARDMHVAAIDVDAFMRRSYGKDATRIYKEVGERRFREIEIEMLKCCADLGPAIISCSEGVVATEEGRRVLAERGFAVLLETTCDGALDRIRSLRTRPLLATGTDAEEVAAERKPQLEASAQATVDVFDKSTGLVARNIEKMLKDEGIFKE
ncbi:shikimate kinase [Slackia heliotrinireducens]|uniref:shikimate kinase n=1 Tax=Slackia heliotrinireducens TaxID=84110 RepID=UPI0033146874